MKVCPTCAVHGTCDGTETETYEHVREAKDALRDWLNGRATMSPVAIQAAINLIAPVDIEMAFEFQVALSEMLWRRLSETSDRVRSVANSIKELLAN